MDSFDTHAKIPAYFEAMDKAAKASGKLSVLSVGWDPGLFSINRLYFESVLSVGLDLYLLGQGRQPGIRTPFAACRASNGAFSTPCRLERHRTGAQRQ